MKLKNNDQYLQSQFVILHQNEWLEKQRIAGRVASGCLKMLQNLVAQSSEKTMLELDKMAHDYIFDNGCEPTFFNYKGFPNSVCISINNVLVHGIPDDTRLTEGDLVSFDLGATYQGAIADNALTCIFGSPKNKEHQRLVQATEEALMESIKTISIGKRIGCIGYCISKVAKKYGYAVVENYGGHGIGWNTPHAHPFVANKDVPENGIRFTPNMTIAIEPLFVIGNSSNTRVAEDGWSVLTTALSAHFEHTIYIHQNCVEIITSRGENKCA